MKFLRLALLLLLPATAALAASHDFYICAATNKNYVIGSTIVTINGVFRHEGNDWTHIGNNDTSVVGLAFDPRDHRVFYTAALNGCWRTLDGGQTWRCTTSWDFTEPRDVLVDPFAPDRVYLALPDGIAVSPDRGNTWPRMEHGLPARGKFTERLAADRTQAGRVFAACETGIYLTENAAQSWRQVFRATTTVYDIEQSPHDPKLWLAVTQCDGALISHDGGLTWRRMQGVPSEKALYNVAFDPTHPGHFAIGSWTYGVLTSEDGGETWRDRNAGLPGKKAGYRTEADPGPHCVWQVGVNPDTGRLYASVEGEALYVSDDFGRTWKNDGLEGSAVSRFVFVPHSTK